MHRYLYLLFFLVVISGVKSVSAQGEISPGYRLLYAADSGNIQNVRVALLENASVHFKTPEGVTALMYASAGGHLDVVELLLEMGADVKEKPYGSNRSALVAAVEHGHVEVAEVLIRKGAEITYMDSDGASLLHIAASSQVWEMVDLLIYYGFPVQIIDFKKRTPLYYAAYYGYDANLRVLLANGANLKFQDEDGNTAMHVGAIQGYFDIVKEMSEQGLDVNLKNKKGFTPLDLAVMYGNDSIVKYLLSKNATINDSIKRTYNTLTLAKSSGNYELMNLLKGAGAKQNWAPHFNSVTAGLFFNGSSDDTYIGGAFGFHEEKYNVDVEFRVAGRVTEYQRLYQREKAYYKYFWEDRGFAGIGLVKSFDFIHTASGWDFGVDAGLYQYISWSEMKGMSQTPVLEFIPAYRVGLSARYEVVRLGLHYDYMRFPIMDYDPTRLNFEIKLYLKYRNDLLYKLDL